MTSLLPRQQLIMRRQRPEPGRPEPGSQGVFEVYFRRPIDVAIAGVTLTVTDHQLQLDLIDSWGGVLGGALLPRPEIEDLT